MHTFTSTGSAAPASARRPAAGVAIAILGILGCFTAAASAQSINGTATFRERTSLPASAVFEAVLEDVSRKGTAPVLLGRTRIETPGPPPIRFEIPYDGSAVRASGKYAVRGTITVNGRVLMATERAPGVLGPGEGSRVELILRTVPSR
jgi:uncharacterized lipoprotein YbaY